MAKVEESREFHQSSLLPRTQLILILLGSMLFALSAWLIIALGSQAVAILLSGAVFVGGASAFLAGNTFRLKDIRKRRAYEIRSLPRDAPERREAWAALVPPSTIKGRLQLSAIGAAIALVAQLGVLVYAQVLGFLSTSIIACLLGLVISLLCFVGGTYSRPVD